MSQHETIALRQLATQRGARMQILREAMVRGQDWEAFLADRPEAAAWFDEDGVPVRGEAYRHEEWMDWDSKQFCQWQKDHSFSVRP